MKDFILLVLLAMISTGTIYSSPFTDYDRLEGYWYDDYTDTQLEIKSTRKGIKVRQKYGRRSKSWRRYNHMGGGLYDDCKGSVIIAISRNTIKWKTGYGRPIVLNRYDSYGRRGYGDSCDYNYNSGYGYNSGRSGYNYNYGRNRSSRRAYAPKDYCGDWYSDSRGLNLSIEIFGNGLRARRKGQSWTSYDSYGYNDYRDRRGNRYFFDGGELCWQSYDRRRTYRFKGR